MLDYDTDMEDSERRLDRFSELPNSLIHLILSFLPMRDVVKTSLLSKRWKNLWITVPCLNFCDLLSMEKTGEDETEEVRSFVNRALIFWRGVEIQKFKIDIDWVFDEAFADDVDLWVRFAVEHKVEDLSVHLMYEDGEMDWKVCKQFAYTPPVCLNSCSSLKKLSLMGCNLRLSVSPPWNHLKSLKLHGFTFGESLINRILLGCPNLEVFDLRIVECYENLNIRSTSLKWLKIEKFLVFEDDKTSKNKEVLRIRCPNLESLVLLGVLYPRYVFTKISSLTNVTLGFNGTCDYEVGNEMVEETMKQIFTTFQHVDKVTLSYWCLQVLAMLQMKYPASPNVKFFPNLKSLVIIQDRTEDSEEFDVSEHLEYEITLFDPNKYLEFETKLSKSFMLQLKTVDITSSLRKPSTLRFIELLLKEASVLEKLVIRLERYACPNWFKIAEGLLCMPRSSFAKVILKEYKMK